MLQLKAWIYAARPRTLPLSVSGILVGTALANSYGTTDYSIFILAILTTIGFQVTSNFANDYGDGVKGTDNEDRIGPKRALQSGMLTRGKLKRGISIAVVVNVILVLLLLYISFGLEYLHFSVLFLALAGVSIWAAIRYTVGDNAYGYRGLGDISVFVFFGLVGVLGSLFLYLKTIPVLSILPAISMGLLSVGVLNLNNLRDYESDTKAGKNTLVVQMGFKKGKQYHTMLLLFAFIAWFVFLYLSPEKSFKWICLLGFVPIFFHYMLVRKTINPSLLDPELKKLSLSTFFIAMLLCISYIYFL